ncbi:hypothetical protein SAMN05421858_0010 [Haladaptatus litoreus]|uniref:DUF7119 domain-containing protein n=1 Tax=Haladaptatus litoreus TaxID=553468 RepID=A0A1N6UM97_9EURY|nr:hypothetical protein [Haladaptatus litoreus]SIQ66571.1 hypothetical protein SAMN05421858_0010 [Haladaptatus litoreus]
MTDGFGEEPPADRKSPVGEPVIRGDETITGDHANQAKAFDPDDPKSVAEAAETVRAFADGSTGSEDSVYMLRGAAACAALVRGVGSYKGAAEEAGGETTVAFIRKWARVHDLPRSIRRHVALGQIAPTAAKHVARVGGDARYQLAWAILDNSLTVRDVRAIVSEINDGTSPERALRRHGVTPGEVTLSLPPEVYRELRRQAALTGEEPESVVARALERELE